MVFPETGEPPEVDLLSTELERRKGLTSKEKLVDSFGRTVDYLRISLTDRCNFRCLYCLPKEGLPFLTPSKFLTVEEIIRFVGLMGHFGRFRIRLTGGEPLLRKELLEIICALKRLDSVQEVSLTTNGSLLSSKISALKEAGLDRINISLDSLDPRRFKEVTLGDLFQKVYDATFKALEVGFPIKVNIVALKGLTNEEIIEFTRLAFCYPLEIRFLEFMPLCGSNWENDFFLPIKDIKAVVFKTFKLTEEENRHNNVSQTFHLQGGKGKVGFIAPLSEPFCNDCSRIRLTADGKIRPCLFSNLEVDVGQLLKQKASNQKILAAIHQSVAIKPKGNIFQEKSFSKDSTPFIHAVGG